MLTSDLKWKQSQVMAIQKSATFNLYPHLKLLFSSWISYFHVKLYTTNKVSSHIQVAQYGGWDHL